jgi:6-phosphogluconolactonase
MNLNFNNHKPFIMHLNLFTKIFMLLMMPVFLFAQNKDSRYQHLIVGTYTKTQDNGLFVYKFDTKTGKLTFESKTEGIKNPSYLAISDDAENVYAAGEGDNSSAYAFNFDNKSGVLTLINTSETLGKGPCYVTIAPDEKHIITSNYGGGSVSVLPLRNDKSIGKLTQIIQHTGSSVNQSRQSTPHAHSAMFNQAGDKLFVADLGVDKIFIYNYDGAQLNPLTANKEDFIKLNDGAGPRHFTFNKNESRLYVLNELLATITVYDKKDNNMQQTQYISLNEKDFNGTNGAADIHFSNDGKFLYATNRGSVNEIVLFKVNKSNGELTRIRNQSTLGKTPRNFMIDPSDNFLLVANQNSDDVYVFKRNKKTGLLTYTNEMIKIGNPVCLKMTPVAY